MRNVLVCVGVPITNVVHIIILYKLKRDWQGSHSDI